MSAIQSFKQRHTILVTGGAGYIGSHAVVALKDAGWKVAVIDKLVTGFARVAPPRSPPLPTRCAKASVGVGAGGKSELREKPPAKWQTADTGATLAST